MSTLTYQIKLINRVKIPQLPEQYKRCPKQPLHLRTSIYDHLNVFSKSVNIHEDHRARLYWGNELALIANSISPFHLAINPEFGDKLLLVVSQPKNLEIFISKSSSLKIGLPGFN